MRGNRSSEQAIRLSARLSMSAVNHQEWNRSYSSNHRYEASSAGRPAKARSMLASESFCGLTKVPAIIARKRSSRFASVSRSEQKKRHTFSIRWWLSSSVGGGSSATSLTALPGGPAGTSSSAAAVIAGEVATSREEERCRTLVLNYPHGWGWGAPCRY